MTELVLQKHADMVVGDRLSSTYFSENKRPFHNFGNSLMRSGINHLFHSDVKDVMTGYRALSFAFVKTFPVVSTGFEIETEMTIHAVNYRMQVENVIVNYRDRPEGSVSKLNTFSDGIKVLWKMTHMYRDYHPASFFGLIGLVMMVTAMILFLPVLFEYFETGLVQRFPTLIVCGFMALAGVHALFAGFILDVMATKDRKEFEYRLLEVSRIQSDQENTSDGQDIH